MDVLQLLWPSVGRTGGLTGTHLKRIRQMKRGSIFADEEGDGGGEEEIDEEYEEYEKFLEPVKVKGEKEGQTGYQSIENVRIQNQYDNGSSPKYSALSENIVKDAVVNLWKVSDAKSGERDPRGKRSISPAKRRNKKDSLTELPISELEESDWLQPSSSKEEISEASSSKDSGFSDENGDSVSPSRNKPKETTKLARPSAARPRSKSPTKQAAAPAVTDSPRKLSPRKSSPRKARSESPSKPARSTSPKKQDSKLRRGVVKKVEGKLFRDPVYTVYKADSTVYTPTPGARGEEGEPDSGRHSEEGDIADLSTAMAGQLQSTAA